jgi:hypothetical protein
MYLCKATSPQATVGKNVNACLVQFSGLNLHDGIFKIYHFDILCVPLIPQQLAAGPA